MATKKLLNVVFKPSVNSTYSVTLGSVSNDSATQVNAWTEYQDATPQQAGCLVWNQDNGENLNILPKQQQGLYEAFTKTGYAGRAFLLPSDSMENVKLYLNGRQFDDEGNPQPYIVFESHTGYWGVQAFYYSADNTFIGNIFALGYFGGEGRNHCTAFFGKLYEDGTTSAGQIAVMAPKPFGAGYSDRNFFWKVEGNIAEGSQLIQTAVMDDLKNYLPVTPEALPGDTGEGDFDASSDPIGVPGLPSKSALATGLINMYLMSDAELHSLEQVLWDPNGLVANLLAMFQNPMEGMINLSLCPVQIDAQYRFPNQQVIVGNFTFPGFTSTQISYPYKKFNFGTINLNEFWGNFSDYSPYTKAAIFLPYIGIQSLSVNDLMNGAVNLQANVDVFTGSIQYFLFSSQLNPRNHGHTSVLYSWTGNMKYNIPLTGSDFNSAVIRMIANTVSAGVSMAEGGSSPGVLNLLGNTHVYSRGGGSGGAPGILGIQTPYLILERPEMVMAENYNHSLGVPNETTDYLKNYPGEFAKVREIHLEISNAKADELREIERILREGVIV